MVQKVSIFISHISEEGALAAFLKDRIRRDFLGIIEVFVSSDNRSIAAGADWLASLRDALERAQLLVALCSGASIKRPWVNFEIGAAWLKELPIVPLCHSGLEPKQLEVPLSLLQGGAIDKAESHFALYGRLAALSGLEVPQVDFQRMAREASEVLMAQPPAVDTTEVRAAAGDLARRALAGEVAAMYELALARAPEAFDTLTGVARKAVNDQLRTEAIAALGELGDPRSVAFLSELIVKSKFPVTKACARVLAGSRDPAVIPVLIRTMRLNADWMSSQACVDALGEFAPDQAATICPALVEALGQGAFVSDSARQALAQYGAAALPALLRVLDDAEVPPSLLREAVEVVGLCGEQTARGPLRALGERLKSRPEFGGTSRPDLFRAIDNALQRLPGD